MLVALYRENKSAFAGNNMNRQDRPDPQVPSADEVGQIERRCQQGNRTHVADWKGIATSSPAGGALPRPDTSVAGTVLAARLPASPAADSKDVPKLPRLRYAAAGKGGSRDRLNALQEEVTAKDKALKEAQSRVADLEKQIRDMQRLLDLKGAAPAKPDTKVAVAPPVPTKAPEPVKVPEPPKAEVKPPEPPKPVEPPKVAGEAPTRRSLPKPPKPGAKAKPARRRRRRRPRQEAPPPPRRETSPTSCSTIPYIAGGGMCARRPDRRVLLHAWRRKAGAEGDHQLDDERLSLRPQA
jgi:pilus assembly protein FimV